MMVCSERSSRPAATPRWACSVSRRNIRPLVALVLLAQAGCNARPSVAPNIVVVVADDLDLRSAQALPFYQRLVARGLEFRQHLTRTPICAPSRASLLTGLGYERHGVGSGGRGMQLAAMQEHEARTLGPILSAAGYRTMFAGKYVNQTRCSHRAAGWDRWVLVCRALYDELGYKVNDDGRSWKPRVYQTDFLRERALDFLRENDPRPAALYLAPPAPHGPMNPAPRHAAAAIPPFVAAPSFSGDDADARFLYERRMRTALALGELVEALIAQLETSDRPWLLLFTADNGLQNGAHGLLFKDVVYEESVRVPLVIVGSDIRPATWDQQTIHEDVAATVLARAGTLPSDLDGADLLDGARHPRVSLHAGTSDAVRTTRSKRVTWNDGRVEVFDLRADPYEMTPRKGQ